MNVFTAKDMFDSTEAINVGKGMVSQREPEHVHEFLEMTYIFSGNGVHRINGADYPVSRGSLLFINFHQIHEVVQYDQLVYANILIKPEFISKELLCSDNASDLLALSVFSEFRELNVMTPSVRFIGAEMLGAERLIETMLAEYNEKKPGFSSAIQGLLQTLLVWTFRRMRMESGDARLLYHFESIIPQVIRHIEKNLSQKLSPSELAKQCFYNPSYFSRAFHACFGMTFTEYVQRRRIEEAIQMLTTTDMGVDAIGHQVGYSDRKTFYKYFKQLTGTSPGKYRKGK